MDDSDHDIKRQTDSKWSKLDKPPLEPLVIEEEKQEPFKCWGYSRSILRTVITCIVCVLTVGFLLLLFYWKPNWKLKMMYSKCPVGEAQAVLIQDSYRREHVKYIRHLKIDKSRSEYVRKVLVKDVVINGIVRYFWYQKMKYIWDPLYCTFFILKSPELNSPCINFYRDLQSGLFEEEVNIRQEVFGLNTITITVKPIIQMLFQEVLNPFYVFQIYSISVWIAYEYWSFAACILIMTLISLTASLYVTRKQSTTLRKMTESCLKVKVLRPNGSVVLENEDQLVPGDVVIIPPRGCTMTCDAVLINGTCIVNESVLTGESVPVTKVSLSSQQSLDEQHHIYSPDTDKRHTLFCGTRVVQTRLSGYDAVKAVVVQTGFSTLKGTLVRSILYPRPMEFQLYRDAMMFVGSYIALAFVGVIYSAWILVANELNPRSVTLLTMDTLTIAIQPLLPVALTTGMLYAQIRLKKQGIFCISPQRINLSGVLDVFCFDKTGTLTEDGLDLLGYRAVCDDASTKQISFSSMETSASSLSACPFLYTMVTCHSLAVVEGKVQGDPMDLKMFQATGWTLEETEMNVGRSIRGVRRQLIRVKPSIISDRHMSEYSILKQFTFSSSLQRMSVIAQSEISREFAGFVKGAPETIVSLCRSQSVPDNFEDVLESYTSEGFRVLALAWKPLINGITATNYQTLTRDAVESDLTFLGILIWQNKLKPESPSVIKELQRSSIRTIMITGDNILTAVSVAGKCGMISPDDTVTQVSRPSDEMKGKLVYRKILRKEADPNANKVDISVHDEAKQLITGRAQSGKEHYVLDGKTFAFIQDRCPDILPSIVVKCTVFARMAPQQKQELVEALQELDYFVGMCGDGANDCGALKTAHAGISLSEAEASVASPFTSSIPNVTCVPMLIKEGRSALVTSFGLFKYIAMYTFVMYVTTSITKKFGSYPSNWMFTTWDIVMATSIVLLMGRSGPHDKIASEKPPTRLLRAPNMFSLFIHIVILSAAQVGALLLLRNQTWYTQTIPEPDGARKAFIETTVVFLVANFQYVFYGMLFTPGRPYRQPLKSNPLYATDLIMLTILSLLLLFLPFSNLEKFMVMAHIPDFKFRAMILGLCLANCLLSFAIEKLVIPREGFQKMLRCWTSKRKLKYESLEVETRGNQTTNTESVV